MHDLHAIHAEQQVMMRQGPVYLVQGGSFAWICISDAVRQLWMYLQTGMAYTEH